MWQLVWSMTFAEWGSAAVVALGSVVTAADARRMMKPRRPRVPDDPRELTIDLLPEGEVDDEQVETTLERGLGFNLPGYLPRMTVRSRDLAPTASMTKTTRDER